MQVLNSSNDDIKAIAEPVASTEKGGEKPDGPKNAGGTVKPGEETEFTNAVQKSIEAVREQIASDPASMVDPDDPLPGVPDKTNVDASSSADPVLSAASGANLSSNFHTDPRLVENQLDDAVATIEQRHKDAFVESVITGDRYRETFDLLGGRARLVIRSRSSMETEAITAYARRMVVTGAVRTDYDYSALMRKLLAIAQVDELNGVKFPEMQEPLFFTETKEEMVPPGWEGLIRKWGDRPEAVMAAVVRCILEFEARYWEMIRKVNDRDFWVPAGSTGE